MSDTAIHSLGLGLATRNAKQEIIEVYYPEPLLSPDTALSSLLLTSCTIQDGQNAVLKLIIARPPHLLANYWQPIFRNRLNRCKK